MPHIDDINDRVLIRLAQEEADANGSGRKFGEPPDDDRAYETRVAPGGARWYRLMRLAARNQPD